MSGVRPLTKPRQRRTVGHCRSFVHLCSLLPDADSWAIIASFFHIPPRQMEPAVGKSPLNRQPVQRRFPRPRKCPAPTRRAGHFHVRLSGRYNALYLAVGKVCARGHPGTPYAALPLPEVRASPPFLPPCLYHTCGGKNTAHGAGTMDEGRGADWPVTIKFLLPNGHKNSTCPKADAIINANRMLTVIRKTC